MALYERGLPIGRTVEYIAVMLLSDDASEHAKIAQRVACSLARDYQWDAVLLSVSDSGRTFWRESPGVHFWRDDPSTDTQLVLG